MGKAKSAAAMRMSMPGDRSRTASATQAASPDRLSNATCTSKVNAHCSPLGRRALFKQR